MIDLHCHLDLYPDPKRIVEECERRGIYVLSVTNAPSAWTGTKALTVDCKRIKTALGLHPEIAHQRLGELPQFDELLDQADYIGEIGLDGGSLNGAYWREQVKAFSYILKSCRLGRNRPMSIHSRGAAHEVLHLLDRYAGDNPIILHWFSGSDRELRKAIDMDCWFSIGPAMLRSRAGRRRVSMMPPCRILTETDGPFGQYRMKPLMPWESYLVINDLIEIWGKNRQSVEAVILANLKQLLAKTMGKGSSPNSMSEFNIPPYL